MDLLDVAVIVGYAVVVLVVLVVAVAVFRTGQPRSARHSTAAHLGNRFRARRQR